LLFSFPSYCVSDPAMTRKDGLRPPTSSSLFFRPLFFFFFNHDQIPVPNLVLPARFLLYWPIPRSPSFDVVPAPFLFPRLFFDDGISFWSGSSCWSLLCGSPLRCPPARWIQSRSPPFLPDAFLRKTFREKFLFLLGPSDRSSLFPVHRLSTMTTCTFLRCNCFFETDPFWAERYPFSTFSFLLKPLSGVS